MLPGSLSENCRSRPRQVLTGVAVSLCLLCSVAGCTGKKARAEQLPMELLAEGDVVFRRGSGAKTHAVLRADTSGIYSHVGMVVRTDSGLMVVHVTPGERAKGETVDRIKLETPEGFFAPERCSKGALARFADTTGCPALAAGRALEFYRRGVLFDHDYDLTDTTKMYCTELVWLAYLDTGMDITAGRRSEIRNFPMYSGTYIFPSDIYKHKSLRVYFSF